MTGKIRRVAAALSIVAAVAILGCDSVSAAENRWVLRGYRPYSGLIPPAPHFHADAVFFWRLTKVKWEPTDPECMQKYTPVPGLTSGDDCTVFTINTRLTV